MIWCFGAEYLTKFNGGYWIEHLGGGVLVLRYLPDVASIDRLSTHIHQICVANQKSFRTLMPAA
jgi:hypothetical protein